MMVTFIANRIEEAHEISVKSGQAKYKAYFVKTNLYRRYQDAVNAILIQDGFEDCIVEN